ncbi:MAG: MFS transporter, partial [Chloroflexi bacterium CFX1]|nr:MFS transporter [Chloroflexi bacterium CFX1]
TTLSTRYPRQYWLMILGIVISTAGGSMVWPFMLIYAGGKLGLPLSAVASLISINAGVSLFSSFLAGSLADKIGRKAVMVASLAMIGGAYAFMVQAETYLHFAILMAFIGLSTPLYQVGADAMLADMIPAEQRTDAYAINRIAHNAAFGIGPAIGGVLASTSYTLAFYGAAIGFAAYSVIWILFARETLKVQPEARENIRLDLNGYPRIFKDKTYMAFVAFFALGMVAPSLVWILMPVYAKTNYNILEALFGWIPTTNAAMCVFIQYAVTNVTRRYKTLPVLATGMLLYALGVGSVALASGFWGFWVSMVVITFGELTVVPTASKYVADISPEDMRGRYMSLYWFGWGISRMLAPLIGGFLNDVVSPQSIWVGGFVIGSISVLGLILLNRLSGRRSAASSPAGG